MELRWKTSCCLFLFLLLSGCQTIQPLISRGDSGEAEEISLEDRHVTVSGSQFDKLTLDIPTTGLTLSQVVARVGGPNTGGLTPEDAKELRQNTLVALYRGATPTESKVYYIPLALIEHDFAGRILLSANEHIGFLDWHETSLGKTKPREDNRFAVSGIVERPDFYTTQRGHNEGRLPLIQIENIATSVAAVSSRIGDTEADLIYLTRQNRSGISEKFFIPLVSGKNTEMLEAYIAEGDSYFYAQLMRLPIVLSSLLTPYVREQEPIARRRNVLDRPSQLSTSLVRRIVPSIRRIPNPLPGLLPSIR